MTTNIGVFIIVINSENQVLLGERKNAYKAGMYGCPGGRLELEESLENCAKRELLEETGLTANHLAYVGVIRERQEDHTFIHFAFSCKDFMGEPQLKEPEKCESWGFYDPSALPAPLLPGHQAGIDLMTSEKTYLDLIERS